MKKPTTDTPPAEWQAGFAQWTDEMARLHRSVDPFGIGASLAKVAAGWLTHPAELAAALADLARDLQALQLNAWQTVTGLQPRPRVKAAADDARFADPGMVRVAGVLAAEAVLPALHALAAGGAVRDAGRPGQGTPPRDVLGAAMAERGCADQLLVHQSRRPAQVLGDRRRRALRPD